MLPPAFSCGGRHNRVRSSVAEQSSGSKEAPPTVRFAPEAEVEGFRVLRNKKPALLRAFCVQPAAATEAEGTADHIRLDGRVFVPAHLTAIRI